MEPGRAREMEGAQVWSEAARLGVMRRGWGQKDSRTQRGWGGPGAHRGSPWVHGGDVSACAHV